MGQTSFALREVRDVAGERQLALETRGNAKEEVKGAVLVSASASGAEQHVRSSLAALGRSTAAEHALSVLSTDNMGMLGVHRAAFAGDVATVGRLLTEAPSLHKAVCRSQEKKQQNKTVLICFFLFYFFGTQKTECRAGRPSIMLHTETTWRWPKCCSLQRTEWQCPRLEHCI